MCIHVATSGLGYGEPHILYEGLKSYQFLQNYGMCCTCCTGCSGWGTWGAWTAGACIPASAISILCYGH